MGKVTQRIRYAKPKTQAGGHFTAEELQKLQDSRRAVNALHATSARLAHADDALQSLADLKGTLSDVLEVAQDPTGAERILQHLSDVVQEGRVAAAARPSLGASASAGQALQAVPPCPTAPTPQTNDASREAIAEVMRLNAMYFAFFDMADRRLDALEKALRESSDTPRVFAQAYPSHVCALFKQEYPKFRRCKASALLYKAMLSDDRKLVASQRSQLQAYVDSLHICTPHLHLYNLSSIMRTSYERMNAFMGLIAKDLLCENLLSYWCIDLRHENRRILPYIVGRQLDLLETFASDSLRLQRIRIPNLDEVIDATVHRRPKRVGTLATSIAAVGAQVLEAQAAQQAEREAQQAASTQGTRSTRSLQHQGQVTEAASDIASDSDAEDDEGDAIYTERASKLPDAPRNKPAHTPRRLRFAKQVAPSHAASPPRQRPAPAAALGRHKAKARPTMHGADAALAPTCDEATGSGQPAGAVLPEVRLSKRGSDTLRRLMAPSYRQKVKKQEYQQLLNEFVLLNGPSGTGYLKRIRQKCDGANTQATGPLRFNQSRECIWFQRCDETWVCHSFHYPHERDSTVELPAGMLHDYRNIFDAFAISA